MRVHCPVCERGFDLQRDTGEVICPHCATLLRAESFGDTQELEVGGAAAEESDPAATRRTSGIRPQPAADIAPEPRGSSAPQEFAGYRIISELGRGGMGVVYKAHDRKLDRVVAIKVLLAAEHASSGDVQRFFREAVSVAKLQHPNIVPIYEMKTHEGRHYFTMDYVEGQPLGRLIRDRRPGLRRSLEIVEKVAHALQHAHERGVIHRDLKPANIIIAGDGEPKITDFGLAKTISSEEGRAAGELTKTGLAIGTPHYMAPEQAAGRSKEADPRTDVYSLGCVLYELLGGHPPFLGSSTMDVLNKHLEETAEPPSNRGVRLPEDVVTICMKCLEKEPARRYRSAEHLAEDIRRYLNGEPITARRASVVYMVKRHLLRHKTATLVSAATVLLLVLSVIAHIRTLRRERNQALTQLYYSNIALAQSYVREANITHADLILNSCPPEMRGWEWGRVKSESHQELVDVVGLGGVPIRPVFSPDGKTVTVEVRAPGEVEDGGDAVPRHRISTVKIDARTGAVLETSGPHERSSQSDVYLSPNGRYRARILERGGVLITDLRAAKPAAKKAAKDTRAAGTTTPPEGTGAPEGEAAGPAPKPAPEPAPEKQDVLLTGRHERVVRIVAFDPRNRYVATAALDKRICVWKLEDGTPVREIHDQPRQISELAFSPDGSLLASGDVGGRVHLWRPTSGNTKKQPKDPEDPEGLRDNRVYRELVGHTADINSLVFGYGSETPKSHVLFLASSSVDRTVRIWNMRTHEEKLRLVGHADSVSDVAFSPDGRLLASCSQDGSVKIWDAHRQSTQLVLEPELGGMASLAVSRDGRHIYAGAQEGVAAWETASGRPLLSWPSEGPADQVAALSPDGSTLASAGDGGEVRLRDAATGRLARVLRYADEHTVLALAFSPSGRRLAAAGTSGIVKVWDPETGRELLRPGGHSKTVRALAYSPDGKYLASASDDCEVIVWDSLTARRVQKITDRDGPVTSSWAVAFSPDGRELAAAFMNRIRIVDLGSWRERRTLQGHPLRVFALAYSPDGRRLATAGKDGTLRLWDPETGRELLKLEGHTDWVSAVSFDPRGRLLASCSRDGTVRIWLAADWDAAQSASAK